MGVPYAVEGSHINTDNTTVLYVAQAATPQRRIGLTSLILGCKAAPADQATAILVERITDENATPGGTAKTPRPYDPAEPAATFTAVEGATAEPTFPGTAEIMLRIALHQRGTHHWVARDEKHKIIVPATEDNGLACVGDTPSSAYIQDILMTVEE